MTTINSLITFTKILPKLNDSSETLVTGNLTILQPMATVDRYVTMVNVPVTIGRNRVEFFRSSNDDLNTSGATIISEGRGLVKRTAYESLLEI